MCGEASVDLPKHSLSAREARRFVSEHCNGWRLGALRDDIVLPVSELVTNALVHGRSRVTLHVCLTQSFVEVSVGDDNPRSPVMRPVRVNASSDIDAVAARLDHLPDDPRDPVLHEGAAGSITAGRGLQIVDVVADEWGTASLSPGKRVWFRVRTPAGWQPPAPCAC